MRIYLLLLLTLAAVVLAYDKDDNDPSEPKSDNGEHRRLLREKRSDKLLKEIHSTDFPDIDGLWFERFNSDRTIMYALAGKFENLLHVFNSSDPLNLRHIVNCSLGDDDLWSFMINDQETVAIAGFKTFINIFKVELDKGLITLTKTFNVTWPDPTSYTWSFTADGTQVFHRGSRGLNLMQIDVTDPEYPFYVGNTTVDYPGDHIIQKFTIDAKGETAFLTVSYIGLFIVNITDINNSNLISICNSGVRNRFIERDPSGDYIYVSDLYNGFVVVDIRQLQYPTVMSSLVIRKDFPGIDIELKPMWFAEDYKLAYLNTYEGIHLVVNLHNLHKTEIETTLTIWTSAFKILKDYKYAMMFRYSKYQVFDLSNLFMGELDITPTFKDENRPISFTPFNFTEARENNRMGSIFFREEQNLLIYVNADLGSQTEFQFYDTSEDLMNPRFLGSFEPYEDPDESKMFYFELNKNSTILYYAILNMRFDSFQFQAANITDKTNVTFLSDVNLTVSDVELNVIFKHTDEPFKNVVISPDEQTGFLVQMSRVRVFDISDPTNLKEIDQLIQVTDQGFFDQGMTIERDGRQFLLVLSEYAFQVFDITNPRNIFRVGYLSIPESGGYFHLSDDQQILHIAGGWDGVFKVNMTNLREPTLIRIMTADFNIKKFMFLADGNLLLISNYETAVLDFTQGGEPTVRGTSIISKIESIVQLKGTDSYVCLFKTTKAQRKAYKMSLYVSHLIYIDTEIEAPLELGDSYRTLNMYAMRLQDESVHWKTLQYTDVWQPHIFIKTQKYSRFENGHVSQPFPKWVTADTDNSRILLQLDTPDALGHNYIYAQASLEVPDAAFVGLRGIRTVLDSTRLKKSLIRQGYLDRDYISSDYNPQSYLKLEREFSPNEGIVSRVRMEELGDNKLYESMIMTGVLERVNDTHSILDPAYNKDSLVSQVIFHKFTWDDYYAIDEYFYSVKEDMLEPRVREILNKYYLEMVGEFYVQQSLNLTSDRQFAIYSKSKNLIEVKIELDTTHPGCEDTVFIDDQLGFITLKGKAIKIEGNIIDINKSLARLRINQAGESRACPATTIVSDQLNPRLEETFEDIRNHTTENVEPLFKMSLADQFYKLYPEGKVQYNTQFEFAPVVKDSPEDTLNFKIYVQEVPEEGGVEAVTSWRNIEFEEWIQYDPVSGKMTGSPKQGSVFKQYFLKIEVTDGYKTTVDVLKINVRPTLLFILDFVFQFGSLLAVTVGVWKYRDELHAIIFKSRYMYNRKEQALVGKDFCFEIPIIRLELEQSNPMIRHMRGCGIRRQGKMPALQRKYKKKEWMSAYFIYNDFQAITFMNDLATFNDPITEEEEQQAIKQFAFRVCHFVYAAANRDVEDRIMSVFSQNVQGQPIWTDLKGVISDVITNTNSGKMQTGLITYSDQIKVVRGYKTKSFPDNLMGKFMGMLLKRLNLHIVAYPLPTSMPVWLSCEVDANYIIFIGQPREENKGEITFIRIFDSNDYIIREFEIEVDIDDTLSQSESVIGGISNAGSTLGIDQISRGFTFSRRFTMGFRKRKQSNQASMQATSVGKTLIYDERTDFRNSPQVGNEDEEQSVDLTQEEEEANNDMISVGFGIDESQDPQMKQH